MIAPRRAARGFVLPLTMLVTFLMTTMLASALVLSSSDRMSADNFNAGADAWSIAQAGLDRYVATTTTQPRDGNSVRYTLPGGFADVVVRRIRPSVGGSDPIWLVRSTGQVTSRERGIPAATRTVAQLARWALSAMDAIGAMVASNGVTRVGTSGTIAGADACRVASALPGVTTYSGGWTGSTRGISGSPAIRYFSSARAVADSTKINWAGIVAGQLPVNYQVPAVPFPNFSRLPASSYPIIQVTGNITLTSANWGRGLLVVTGNLITSGSWSWNGVVLVGGTLGGSGAATITGATVSGLDVKLGRAVGRNSLSGQSFRYNSCQVANATVALAGFTAFQDVWFDNWATY